MGLWSWLSGGSSDNHSSSNVSDDDIIDVVRGTGCEHIQHVISGMSDEELVELVREGGANQVLETIYDGTQNGYAAASSSDNALDILSSLLGL